MGRCATSLLLRTWLLSCLLVPLAVYGEATVYGDESVVSPESDYYASLQRFRDNLDFRFGDRILSPLTEADRQNFEGLAHYDVVPALAIPAILEPARDRSTFAMPTYNNRTLAYSHFGTIVARLDGSTVRLKAFRREDADTIRDFLLIPFRDATNGDETYAGGRYIEIDLPLPGNLVLDFNRATNPWCAYDAGYACPIPPRENQLPMPIRAGEKRYR